MAFRGKPIKKHNWSFNNSSVPQHYRDFYPIDMDYSPHDNTAISEIYDVFHRFLCKEFLVVETPDGYYCKAYEQRKKCEG